jgi:hypothetical protein
MLSGCAVRSKQKVFLDEPIRPDENIAEIITLDGRVFMFDRIGARIDSGGHTIAGVLETGEPHSVPTDSILFLRAHRTNSGASATATVPVVTITAFMLLVAAFAF